MSQLNLFQAKAHLSAIRSSEKPSVVPTNEISFANAHKKYKKISPPQQKI